MFDAGEIGLCGISEQIVMRWISPVQQGIQSSHVEMQPRCHQRRVGNRGALGSREFPDSVYGVVVVESKQVATIWCKRERLANQLESSGGVLREYEDVIVRRSVEITQHTATGTFDMLGHRHRGRGFAEWGLPKTPERNISKCFRSCDSAYRE